MDGDPKNHCAGLPPHGAAESWCFHLYLPKSKVPSEWHHREWRIDQGIFMISFRYGVSRRERGLQKYTGIMRAEMIKKLGMKASGT